jgi:TonB-dependent receptor
MQNKTFKKTRLATTVSIILGTTILMPVSAAEMSTTAKENIEVIQVTGRRSSIKESTRLKRDASGVVDAISAEDIGKFPDTNLAESLQRITGVSIDRSNGEGSRVTVRGFGPEFNMVTLNGRAMPASSLPEGGNASDSRAYDFQNLSSGAIQSVAVYKTGKASIATGGIGATININTAKPFDNPGIQASIGGKALYDTSVRDGVRDYNDKVTPELSGLFSWTDDDEVFGASINGSFSERNSSATGARINRWRNRVYIDSLAREVSEPYTVDGVTYPATNIVNGPTAGENYQIPADVAYRLEDTQRERTNSQLTFQYRPIENLTTTFDYTYTKLDSVINISDLSGWYDSPIGTAEFTEGVNPTPVTYIENRNESAPRDIALKQINYNSKTEDKSIGFNVDWDVNDYFNLTLDIHDSTSESSPTEAYGNAITVGIGSNVFKSTGAIYNSSGLPIMTPVFDDCDTRVATEATPNGGGYNCNGVLDVSDLGTTMMQTAFSENTNDIQQFRLDGSVEFDEGSINFGIESRSMENTTVQSNTGNQTMGGWGASNVGELPEGFLEPLDFNDSLDDYKVKGAWTDGYRGDSKEIGQWAADKYDLEFGRNPNESSHRVIEEDITALYFEINIDGELGNRPYHITAGLRYESTDSKSSAKSAIPSAVKWESNDDFQVIQGSFANAENYFVENSYDNLLPSFDFDIEVIENVKARFSYSKTIARPSYGHLNAQSNVSSGPDLPTILDDQSFGSASKGNPLLVPLESDNLDLSAEWYFEDTSYVSLGYYEKRVENFVGTQPLISDFFGLRDATNGPRAQQAMADLTAIGISNPNDTQLFSMVAANQLGVAFDSMTPLQFEEAVDILPSSDDPLMQFLYNSPVNNEDAKVYGFEFALQHFFSDTGFGFQANYTSVKGDINFDVSSTETQFALQGLSDTANLVLMYEKYDFSARIAYNWRDNFLQNANRRDSEPEFVESYSQIDVSASYQINDNLLVSFAGINITGEDPRWYGRNKNQFIFGEEGEPRYELGARYTF